MRSGGAITQPTRQPVTEYVFDIESIAIVRSRHPGQRRERDVLARVDEVLVDVVGEGEEIVLPAQLGDQLELVARGRPCPSGCAGVLTTIARVRLVTAARSSSGSIDQSGSCSVT